MSLENAVIWITYSQLDGPLFNLNCLKITFFQVSKFTLRVTCETSVYRLRILKDKWRIEILDTVICIHPNCTSGPSPFRKQWCNAVLKQRVLIWTPVVFSGINFLAEVAVNQCVHICRAEGSWMCRLLEVMPQHVTTVSGIKRSFSVIIVTRCLPGNLGASHIYARTLQAVLSSHRQRWRTGIS